MRQHIKKAWAALETKRVVFVLLAVLLAGYLVLASFNVVDTEEEMVQLVSAARDDGGDTFVLAADAVFENKILEFLKVDKLCGITADQANVLSESYTFETREYYIASQAKTVFVLYIEGPKASLPQLESVAGEIDNGDCRIVHGRKMIALLGPSN